MNLANKIANMVRGKHEQSFSSDHVEILFPMRIGSRIFYADNSKSIDVFSNRICGQGYNTTETTLLVIGGYANKANIDVPRLSELFDDFGVILYGDVGSGLLRKFGNKAVYVDNVSNAAILANRLAYKHIILTPLHKSITIKEEIGIFKEVLMYY